jgi:ELWxxDGT repeat protein
MLNRVIAILFSLCLVNICLAQDKVHLLKDINTGGPNGSSIPYDLTAMNGFVFFAADDGVHGKELWKTDGTASGTTLVKDVVPGSGGSYPDHLEAVNGTLFFSIRVPVDESNYRIELWKSDGTESETAFVKSEWPLEIDNLIELKGLLYFTSQEIGGSLKLWKSDGTQQGTSVVKELNGGWITNVTKVNDTLFFANNAPGFGFELWKSDGTSEGTAIVRDINKGGGSSYPKFLTNNNGVLFFYANDGIHGDELWKSDGNSAGTRLVKDIRPGRTGSQSKFGVAMLSYGGVVYFTPSDGVHGPELWRSDGTPSGTTLVKDIIKGRNGSVPAHLAALNGKIFFSAIFPGKGKELGRTDGTAQGTQFVKDLTPGRNGSSISDFVSFKNSLLFAQYDSLWTTDGTFAGTFKLIDHITPGYCAYHCYPPEFVVIGNQVFFNATDDRAGNEIWKTDGTRAGTRRIKDIFRGSGSSSPLMAGEVNGQFLFFTRKDTNTFLWRTDGTTEGTVRINTQDYPLKFGVANNRLWYSTYDSASDRYLLWKSDGTTAGTTVVSTFDSIGDQPANFIAFGGKVYFTAFDLKSGYELWRTDGTTSGTSLFKEIIPGPNYSAMSTFVTAGNLLYFFADTGKGTAIWKTDGTASGTSKIKVIPKMTAYTFVQTKTFNGILYFSFSEQNAAQLWKSDGTANGTVMVHEWKEGFAGIENLTVVNDSLFFSILENTSALWKTDGTSSGTVLIKNIFSPNFFTEFNGKLYFNARTSQNEDGFWVSDGTEQGTIMIMPIYIIGPITVWNGNLYLTVFDFETGSELWISDGTAQGTRLLKDIWPGRYSSNIESFNPASSGLYFGANDGFHGFEPWKVNP